MFSLSASFKFLGVGMLALWLASGCYYDPSAPAYGGGGYGGGYAPAPPRHNGSTAYDRGFGYGRYDASRGLPRQASRHWHVVPGVERETFAHGYNEGYVRGGGSGHGSGVYAGQEAYSTGLRYGATDARRGLARQASRHWQVVQPAHRQSFAQGYNAGYVRN